MDTNARQCNCGVDCEETNYDMIPSSSEFPSENFKIISGWSDGQAEDRITLSIYYKSLNFRNVQENETYQFSTIISSLGGALSLYLGISLVMIFEIIELLIDLAGNIFKKLAISGGRRSVAE